MALHKLSTMKKRVLIIDNSPFNRKLIAEGMHKAGYEIVGTIENGKMAMQMVMDLRPELVVLGNFLTEISGQEVLDICKDENLSANVITISVVRKQNTSTHELSAADDFEFTIKPLTKERQIRMTNIHRSQNCDANDSHKYRLIGVG